MLNQIICVMAAVFFSLPSKAQSPLKPIKLDSPRDTFQSYFDAMKDYNKGLKSGDDKLLLRLNDAARTFDLKDIPYLAQKEKAREAAILLKEVIDRVIVVQFDKIPNKNDLQRWRLKDTEIVILKITEGDHSGEYLFSSETRFRAEEFYQKVKHLPYLEGTTKGAGYREPWLEKAVPEWAKEPVLGLAKWQWVGIFASIFIGLILKVLIEFFLKGLRKLVSWPTGSVRDQIMTAVERPVGLLVAAGFWYVVVQLLRLGGKGESFLLAVVQIVGSVTAIWMGYRLTDVITRVLDRLADKTESDLDDQLVPLIGKSLRIFVVVVGILATLQNLGINVLSLMAGLGLGGLAFALAAKDTAANLFGSIMIILDRPFKLGDWIVAGNVEGNIEDIGFRSTRIRTFYNSQISIPNAELASLSIDNMGRREFRRVRASLGVTYDTSPERLEKFLEGIKEIIRQNGSTRKDYFHVVFNNFGPSSLDILIYYFLKVPDWTVELKEKQEIYLQILKLAEQLKVNFAFPTQSLHIESLPEKVDEAMK